MLRTSGHENQHADDASDYGQNDGQMVSEAAVIEAKGISLTPSNDDFDAKDRPAEVILNGEEMPVDDASLFNITPSYEEAPAKKGMLRRLFNKASLTDMAAGMAISGLARYSIIGAGVVVGISGLPIALGGAVAAGVARTAWTIHKERKAYEAETNQKISFMEWARKLEIDEEGNVVRDNAAKYRKALLVSTAFATLGSTFMTYAVPHIEQWAAPVIDRMMKSETMVAISGAVAAVWKDITGAGAPPVVVTPPKVDDETIRRGTEAFDQMMRDKGIEYETITPDAIARRVAEAHDAVQDAVPETPVVAPVLSISDKLSLLTHDNDITERWQGVLARAIDGNVQAQKDVASALLNGTHGFDKNPAQAAELYRAAADAGNIQAQADLAYMQYHGLGGIKADTKSALDTLREHAADNRYVRSVLDNLTGEGNVQESTVSAMQRVSDTVIDPAPANLVAPTPVPVPVTAEGQIPDGATLDVTWNQNAEGVVSGFVRNAPAWLRDGMIIEVPTAKVQ